MTFRSLCERHQHRPGEWERRTWHLPPEEKEKDEPVLELILPAAALPTLTPLASFTATLPFLPCPPPPPEVVGVIAPLFSASFPVLFEFAFVLVEGVVVVDGVEVGAGLAVLERAASGGPLDHADTGRLPPCPPVAVGVLAEGVETGVLVAETDDGVGFGSCCVDALLILGRASASMFHPHRTMSVLRWRTHYGWGRLLVGGMRCAGVGGGGEGSQRKTDTQVQQYSILPNRLESFVPRKVLLTFRETCPQVRVGRYAESGG